MAEGDRLGEIRALAAAATERYEFFRSDDYTLARRERSGDRRAARLVNGQWVSIRASSLCGRRWKRLKRKELRWHLRRYMVGDLCAEELSWGREFWPRLQRSAVWRWVVPPLKGGAANRGVHELATRSRGAYHEKFAATGSAALAELRDEALLGYEHQRERIGSAERRATFFLGAAGLTSTLVLANAGLLLGDHPLEDPWRWLAMAVLGVASAFAVAAGLRALQATMNTFVRTPPNGVPRLVERRGCDKDDLLRRYIAALLVGQHRLSIIGEWKIKRMKSARRWFVGAIVAIVVLTGFVLADIGDEQRQEQQVSATRS